MRRTHQFAKAIAKALNELGKERNKNGDYLPGGLSWSTDWTAENVYKFSSLEGKSLDEWAQRYNNYLFIK